VKVSAQVAFDKAAMVVQAPAVKPEPKADGEAKDAVKEGSGASKVDEPAYKLHVLLVEEMLRYTGENGIRLHPVVVRAACGPSDNGFTLDPAKAEPVNARFDIAAINAALNENPEGFQAAQRQERGESV